MSGGAEATYKATLEELARLHSNDYESCDYCGCDCGGGMSPWEECHEDSCPTVLARKALGLPLRNAVKSP